MDFHKGTSFFWSSSNSAWRFEVDEFISENQIGITSFNTRAIRRWNVACPVERVVLNALAILSVLCRGSPESVRGCNSQEAQAARLPPQHRGQDDPPTPDTHHRLLPKE